MGIRKFTPLFVLIIVVSFFSSLALAAQKAYYHPRADRLFWFMLISDTHIGANRTCADNLTWAVNQGRQVIAPQFIVNTGDLTDSSNGSIIPIGGPYQAEWDTYRQILEGAGIDSSFYYDMPGNHDEYSDATLAYYRANSIQGRATNLTQPSWTRQFSYGSYHFLGVCTPGNDGAPFSIWPSDNYGDHAGLDDVELPYIQADLASHTEAQLTLIFGHHPFEPFYTSAFDTGLTYGLIPGFLFQIEQYQIPFYGFGHTHNYGENFRTGFYYYNPMETPGLYYMNISSLGKESLVTNDYRYAVMAVDGNGISYGYGVPHTWPVVMITAPVDRFLGTKTTINPYTYEVPPGRSNPIRALVFDEQPVTQVQFAIDGSPVWHDMQKLEGKPVWEGRWNASMAAPGNHTITVRAQGSSTVSETITTTVKSNVTPAIYLLLN
jgi:hypothetical protein